MIDLFIALVIFFVSCQWALAGVVLMKGREEICLADGLFFLHNVIYFNLVAWA